MQSSGWGKSRSGRAYVCQACRNYAGNRRGQTSRRFSLSSSALRDDKKQQQKQVQARDASKWYDSVLGQFPGRGPVDDSASTGTKDLMARLSRLENEIRRIRDTGGDVLPTLLGELPPTQRRKVEEELHQKTAQSTTQRPRDQAPAKPAIEDRFMRGSDDAINLRSQQGYLNRLNFCLKKAEIELKADDGSSAESISPAIRKDLWRWYSRCKQNVPNFAARLSTAAWHVLWTSQSIKSPSNPDRNAHIRSLGKDMNACRYKMNADQRVTLIEALFLDGKYDEAAILWERDERDLTGNKNVLERFFDVGIRAFAAKGNPQRAQELSRVLLNRYGAGDARVLIPVLRSWNRSEDESGPQRAWALYIRLKQMLGHRMTPEDYEDISRAFLQAGKAEPALAVFKDMLLIDDPHSRFQSPALYWKALGLVDDVRSLTIDASETAKVSLEAMTVLPPKFQNKFFWGGWMKKLLGAGEADSAVLVIELMYKRGMTPDPKWVNGVIGCWIRMGDSKSYSKAEQLAWEMIEQRKTTVAKQLPGEHDGQPPPKVPLPEDVPALTDRRVPDANLETFNVLVEYYLNRDKHALVESLYEVMTRSTEIDPDVYFMNHVFASRFKTKGPREVWKDYVDWAHETTDAARPDIQTFGCLWECRQLVSSQMEHQANRELRKLQTKAAAEDAAASLNPEDGGQDALSDEASITTASAAAAEDTPPFDRQDMSDLHNFVFIEEKRAMRKASGFPSARALFAEMMDWSFGSSAEEVQEAREEFTTQLYDRILRCFVDNSRPDFFAALVAMHAIKERFGAYPSQDQARMLALALEKDRVQQQHQLASLSTSSSSSSSTDEDSTPRKDLHPDLLPVTPALARLHSERRKILATHKIDGTGSRDFRNNENLYLLSELIRRVKARGHRDMGWLDDSIQRAAWEMGVGAIDTGDYIVGSIVNGPVKE
ncbi:MAG: hypothetical protein M1825_002965 [Sarcosagium campestre]|nr:MAG: hypothetical protein M1825_002965 [Sarcosagium campestre]